MSPAGTPRPRDGADQVGTLFAVLADEHRREVLHRLQASPADAVRFDRLVTEVLEGLEAPGGRERVASRLKHATLPSLAEAGVVEYDPRSGAVRYREDPLLERLLRQIRQLAAAA